MFGLSKSFYAFQKIKWTTAKYKNLAYTCLYIHRHLFLFKSIVTKKKYRYCKLLRMIKITNIHYSRTLFDYGFINLTEGHWASSWSLGRKSWQFCQVCTFLLEKYWTYLLYIKNYLWPEGVSWIWPRFSHARSRSLSKMHKSF